MITRNQISTSSEGLKVMNMRRVIGIGLLALSSQLIASPAHAGDCKQSETCTVLSNQDHEGSAMTTAGQAAPSNKAAQTGPVKNNFAEANKGKNAKVLTHSTTLTCVKGHQEFHLNTKSTKCPAGFKKK